MGTGLNFEGAVWLPHGKLGDETAARPRSEEPQRRLTRAARGHSGIGIKKDQNEAVQMVNINTAVKIGIKTYQKYFKKWFTLIPMPELVLKRTISGPKNGYF